MASSLQWVKLNLLTEKAKELKITYTTEKYWIDYNVNLTLVKKISLLKDSL